MGFERGTITVSTWIQTQLCSPAFLRLSELMACPHLFVCLWGNTAPPWNRGIIGIVLSLCHISPGGAFPLFIPSNWTLESFWLHVFSQTKTHWESSPLAYTYCSNAAIRLAHAKCADLTSVCAPLPAHFKNHYIATVHTRVAGPLCSCWIRLVDRQATLDFTTHALNSRAGRSVKCGENRGSCGKHVSTGQL